MPYQKREKMTSEEEIRLKIRKIEALFGGSNFKGEQAAAEFALKRMQETLAKTITAELEYTLTLDNRWSKTLFIALCRRYDLHPYRYARQRQTTVKIKTSQDFMDNVLWPEYQALNNVLLEYINEITIKIITEEIHQNTTDAEEIAVQL